MSLNNYYSTKAKYDRWTTEHGNPQFFTSGLTRKLFSLYTAGALWTASPPHPLPPVGHI